MKPLTIFPQPPPLPKKTAPPLFFHETFKPLKETMKKMFKQAKIPSGCRPGGNVSPER
jgi:hypothetical protein